MGVAIQGGSVTVYDLAGSPHPTAGRESRGATREFEFAWSDIDLLIAECFPPAPSLPGAYPGVAFLYCDSLDIRPQHPDGDFLSMSGAVATYNRAQATLSYSRLPYDPSVSALISRRYSISSEAMTIPSGTLYWNEAGFFVPVQEEEVSAAKVIPTIDHSITRHRVTTAQIPWTAIKANIGKVNDGVLNNSYFTSVADETLLFLGAELSFEFSTDGSQVWTCELRFQEKKVKFNGTEYGWNYFLRPEDSAWMQLVDVDGNTVYDTSPDFDDLFA